MELYQLKVEMEKKMAPEFEKARDLVDSMQETIQAQTCQIDDFARMVNNEINMCCEKALRKHIGKLNGSDIGLDTELEFDSSGVPVSHRTISMTGRHGQQGLRSP